MEDGRWTTSQEGTPQGEDFMFQVSEEELAFLRSRIVTLKTGGRGQHAKYLPHAFTEQGVAMLSSVLRSKRAVEVNIEIMRAFVRLREMLASNRDLAKKLAALEKKYDSPIPSRLRGHPGADGTATASAAQAHRLSQGLSARARHLRVERAPFSPRAPRHCRRETAAELDGQRRDTKPHALE
jgi:hypothetical protein